MNRVSIGTWAYSVGPYADNPVPFGEVVKGLKEMDFDGLELGAFGAHPTPDNHPTKESRQTLRDLVLSNDLEFSGIAGDMWSEKLVNAEDGGKSYLATVRKNMEFAKDLGITLFRVDTVQPPEILDTVEKSLAMDRVVQDLAEGVPDGRRHGHAGHLGVRARVRVQPAERHRGPRRRRAGGTNFGVLFDTCHAYTCGRDRGAPDGRPQGELPADGVLALAKKLRGKINAHPGDRLATGRSTTTTPPPTTRSATGNIDFPPVMQELAAHSGSPHDWWTIDLCFWPDAWPATKKCKQAVDALNALVAGKRAPSKARKSSPAAPKARAKAARPKPARPKRAAKKSGGRGKRR